MKTLLLVALAATLTACGGGGSVDTAASDKAVSQAASNAAAELAKKHPTAPTYTGGFTLVNGVPNGFTTGSSPEMVVRSLAQAVVNEPVKYAALYKLLLSAEGLKITLLGKTLPVSPSGLAQHDPDVVYNVKLTSSGLVLTY